MSDLVERLRKVEPCFGSKLEAVCPRREAADEIERLRADLQFSYENKTASDDTWRKECERLRAALEYYASGIAGRGDIARHALKDKT